MLPTFDNKNRILSRISIAAKTALLDSNVDFSQFITAGFSIRARIRLALAMSFLVALPTLFIGVMRAEEVSEHATALSEFDDYWKHLLETHIAIKELDLTMWAYMAEREYEHGQAVLLASDYLKFSINELVANRPLGFDIGPPGFFEGLANRLDNLIKVSVASNSSMAEARLNIMSLVKEVKNVEKRVVAIAQHEKKAALGSLSKVGRDQLSLFLILLFAIPIFVGFVPGLIVAPLTRLRQIASKIELGQLKDMPIFGKDEVALLARNLKAYFLRKEELDHKKSSKIFEMRNILRSVINRVKEPIFIVDEKNKINYTNERAALLIGLPPHQIEGKIISDCMYCPALKKTLEKAFLGDVIDESFLVSLEGANGRTFSLEAKVCVVRNRDGEISRAAIILFPPPETPDELS